MATRKRSFFSMLNSLNEIILVKKSQPLTGEPFSDFTKKSFSILSDFVKNCSWSSSKSVQFICANYTLSAEELGTLWGAKYGKAKCGATFRVQRANASALLESMLGSVSDVEAAFLSDNDKMIAEVMNRLQTFTVQDLKLEEVLPQETLVSVYKRGIRLEEYPLEDCYKELAFIVNFSQQNVRRSMKDLDLSKLRYLLSVLQSPVIDKGIVNRAKQNLLMALNTGLKKEGSFDYRMSTFDFVNSASAKSQSSDETDYKSLYESTVSELNALQVRYDNLLAESISADGVSQDSDSLVQIGDFCVPDVLIDSLSLYEPLDPNFDVHSLTQEDVDKLRSILLLLVRYDIGTIATDIRSYDKLYVQLFGAVINGVIENSDELLKNLSDIREFIMDDDKYTDRLKAMSAQIVSEYKQSKSVGGNNTD